AVDAVARDIGDTTVDGTFAAVAAVCLLAVLPPLAAAVTVVASRHGRAWAVPLAAVAAPAVTLATAYALVRYAGGTPGGADRSCWLAALVWEPLISISYPRVDTTPIEAVLT